MTRQNFDVNKLRVASPCSVGWETMSGDERVRRCHSCELNIYNISEMTKAEVENLIVNREERVCIRLYKRADGTVLTKDCPVGFRDYQKRIGRFATATLATILSLFSISFAQKQNEKSVSASKLEVVKKTHSESNLTGVILDINGAIIEDAEISLYIGGRKKPFKIKSNKEGEYLFRSLDAGIYAVKVKFKGFKTYLIKNLEIKDNESNKIDIILEPTGKYVTVGIYLEEPSIDTTSSGVTHKITRKQIENLPH